MAAKRTEPDGVSLLRVGSIEVEVRRKDIKNMYLRVLPPDGKVVVSAPKRMGNPAIELFVASKTNWIHARQKAMQERLCSAQREGASGETLCVWGRRYPLRVVEGPSFHMDVDTPKEQGSLGIEAIGADGAQAIYTVRAGSTSEQQDAWLREWQRSQLCEALKRLVPAWEMRTGLHPEEWRTKVMKTRWGTCNIKARRLWFNVRLSQYPPECLEYVVLHELAHLKEPSHNKDFKAILDAFMPNWRSVSKLLDEQAFG